MYKTSYNSQSQYLCGMRAILARQVSWSQYKNVTPEFTFQWTDNQDSAYLKSNQGKHIVA